jgi:hypothetical protein
MTVTQNDRDAMSRILAIMNGENPAPVQQSGRQLSESIELAGPGQVTRKDVDAMASVMAKLNSVSNNVIDGMITEGVTNRDVSEALSTERVANGVKVGRYQITIKEDDKRLAGKQFYSIYNRLTDEILADDISLYETALAVIRHLNGGRIISSSEVRKLLEQDDSYTSHRIDALNYKHRIATTRDPSKRDIFESRHQASLDRCMAAKKTIKMLVNAR